MCENFGNIFLLILQEEASVGTIVLHGINSIRLSCVSDNIDVSCSFSQQNAFQAVLVTDGQRSFVIYLYAFIEWGNFNTNLGFNAGDGLRHVMFPEAFTAAVQSIEETSNVGVRGVYAFRVDGLLIEDRNGKMFYTNQ